MKRGTFVLTPFPFTDLSGSKVRPAVIVSRSNRPGADVIIAFATSYKKQSLLPTDLLVDQSHPEFGLTGLKTASVLKLDKLATVDRTVLYGQLGELPASLSPTLDACLRHALEL
jgi:mRNA interferase MazF